MIEIKELYFRYKNSKDILCGINYKFENGIYGICGANGSGKTTLLKCIMGLIKPYKGEILIDGVPVLNIKRGDLGKKVGYVSASPVNQLFSNSVYDELAFPLKFRNVNANEIKELVENYIHKYKLEDLINKNPLNLSDGQQKRVLLCAIDMQNSDYLIFDEPSASLDKENKYNLIDYLINMSIKKTVIIVSHDKTFLCNLKALQLNLIDGVLK
jgi:energy-coupling factor transporter ATP-binding protein EcfA2